ncbi:MAG TPA: helix-turn-helix transcriptional regulator [Kofleriaceae bacterium]
MWLSRFIESVEVCACEDGRAARLERLPDGRTVLIVRTLASGHGDVSVSGPRKRALFKQSTDLVRGVIIRFKPGWTVPLFGVPASLLTNRYTMLDDLWGTSEGHAELVGSQSVTEILERLSAMIAARPHHAVEPASARLARHAIRLLEAGEPRVDHVAEELGVTARHLRRAFADNIGITPKDFARTVRLQRAVRSVGSRDWGRIAMDAGYYDQAHLISEFRELVGLTPGAFARR